MLRWWITAQYRRALPPSSCRVMLLQPSHTPRKQKLMSNISSKYVVPLLLVRLVLLLVTYSILSMHLF